MATYSHFDVLEDRMEELKVPHTKVVLSLRNIIADLVEAGRFRDVEKHDLVAISRYLDENLVTQAMTSAELRSESKAGLRGLVSDRKEAEKAYLLRRCVQFLFVSEAEWKNIAQDSLVFNVFHYLQKVLPDIEEEFVLGMRQALSIEEDPSGLGK